MSQTSFEVPVRFSTEEDFKTELRTLLQKLKNFCYNSFKALEDADALETKFEKEYISLISEVELMQGYLNASRCDKSVQKINNTKRSDHNYNKAREYSLSTSGATKQVKIVRKSLTNDSKRFKNSPTKSNETTQIPKNNSYHPHKLNVSNDSRDTYENVSNSEKICENVAEMIELDNCNLIPKWEAVEEETTLFPVPEIFDETSDTDAEAEDWSTFVEIPQKPNVKLPIVKNVEQFYCTKRISIEERQLLREKYRVKDDVTGDVQYKCDLPECGKSYRHLAVLERHLNSHLRTTCDECGKQVSLYQLKRHKQIHVDVRAFQCPHCPKNYAVKKYLRGHLKTCLGNRPNFHCRLCKRNFFSSIEIEKHQLQMHCGDKDVMCDACEDVFSEYCINENHQVKKLTPYDCEKCNVGYHTLTEFKEHYKENHLCASAKNKLNKRGRFECSYCQRIFAFRGSLKRHIMTHTGEKPFICEYCCKPFCSNSSLNSHIKSHTGERPYKCQVCLRGYYDNKGLKRHKCKGVKMETEIMPQELTIDDADCEEEIYCEEEYYSSSTT